MKIEKELMCLCGRDIQSKLRTTLLSIKGRMLSVFKHMFLIFKQYYTYFYIFFHSYIFFKKIKNCYLNICTKQTLSIFNFNKNNIMIVLKFYKT